MTTAHIIPKACATCGHLVPIHHSDGPKRYARRRYCSMNCSTTARSGRKPVCQPPPGTGTTPRPSYASQPPTVQQGEWRHRGACCHCDPDMFFPEGHADGRQTGEAAAVAVCRSACPVMAECRAWALATRQEFGVWGGLTERELRNLKTENRANTA